MVLAASVCLGLSLFLLFTVHSEPRIDAKSLSDWIEDLDALHPGQKQAAEAAVRKIGPDAIPFLFRRLNARETALRRLFNRFLIRRLGNREVFKSEETLRSEAVLAFRVLGLSARASLPHLFMLLTNAPVKLDTNAPIHIAQSMSAIGEDSIAFLLKALNNPQPSIRRASLVALIDLDIQAAGALPDVLEKAKDPDAIVRELALLFIRSVCKDKDLIRRLFEDALSDSDVHVRFFAQKELKELKEDNTAVPPK